MHSKMFIMLLSAVLFAITPAAAQQPSGACHLPLPHKGTKIADISTQRSYIVSNVTVAGQAERTDVVRVEIAHEDGPIYLLLKAGVPMIWKLTGDTSRIEHIALEGPPIADSIIAAGVTGMSKGGISFIDISRCTPHGWSDLLPSASNLARIPTTIKGRPYNGAFSQASVSSQGVVLEEIPERGQPSQPPSGVDPDAWRFFQKFDRGGIEDLWGIPVVSNLPAERYIVLPGWAGIVQLLKEGSIQIVAKDTDGARTQSASVHVSPTFASRMRFRIVKDIGWFPAGLKGGEAPEFTLAPGVPIPKGNSGHVCIRQEGTGNPVPGMCRTIYGMQVPPPPPRSIPPSSPPPPPLADADLEPIRAAVAKMESEHLNPPPPEQQVAGIRLAGWGYDDTGKIGATRQFYGPGVVIAPVWAGIAESVLDSGTRILQAALNDADNCLLRSDRTVWCWYRKMSMGQYLNSIDIWRSGKTGILQVMGLPPIRSLEQGLDSCAMAMDGKRWCWKINSLENTADARPYAPPWLESYPDEPALLKLAESFRTYSSAGHIDCAITFTGKVWCWASDARDKNARAGGSDAQSLPREVRLPSPAVQLHADHRASCAVLADGSAWCWQSGSSPFAVVGAQEKVQQIAGIMQNFCVLKGRDGSVWCGGATQSSGKEAALTPVLTASGQPLKAITKIIGPDSTTGCALDQMKSVWCWGKGQKGDPDAAGNYAVRARRPGSSEPLAGVIDISGGVPVLALVGDTAAGKEDPSISFLTAVQSGDFDSAKEIYSKHQKITLEGALPELALVTAALAGRTDLMQVILDAGFVPADNGPLRDFFQKWVVTPQEMITPQVIDLLLEAGFGPAGGNREKAQVIDDLQNRYQFKPGAEKLEAYLRKLTAPQLAGQHVETLSSQLDAARRGDPAAEYNLGMSYALGQGTEQNYAEAAEWLQKAADQLVPPASFALGTLFYYGVPGISQNNTEAAFWLCTVPRGDPYFTRTEHFDLQADRDDYNRSGINQVYLQANKMCEELQHAESAEQAAIHNRRALLWGADRGMRRDLALTLTQPPPPFKPDWVEAYFWQLLSLPPPAAETEMDALSTRGVEGQHQARQMAELRNSADFIAGHLTEEQKAAVKERVKKWKLKPTIGSDDLHKVELDFGRLETLWQDLQQKSLRPAPDHAVAAQTAAQEHAPAPPQQPAPLTHVYRWQRECDFDKGNAADTFRFFPIIATGEIQGEKFSPDHIYKGFRTRPLEFSGADLRKLEATEARHALVLAEFDGHQARLGACSRVIYDSQLREDPVAAEILVDAAMYASSLSSIPAVEPGQPDEDAIRRMGRDQAADFAWLYAQTQNYEKKADAIKRGNDFLAMTELAGDNIKKLLDKRRPLDRNNYIFLHARDEQPQVRKSPDSLCAVDFYSSSFAPDGFAKTVTDLESGEWGGPAMQNFDSPFDQLFKTAVLDLSTALISMGDIDGARPGICKFGTPETRLLLAVRLGQTDLVNGQKLEHIHEIRNADLSHLVLKGLNARGSKWENVNLTQADLTNANFESAHLEGVTLDGARFDLATYDCRTTFPAGFDPVSHHMVATGLACNDKWHAVPDDLRGTDVQAFYKEPNDYDLITFSKLDWNGVNASASRLGRIACHNCTIENADFSDAHVAFMLEGSKMSDTSFRNADLKNSYWNNVAFYRVDFSGADLSNLTLNDVSYDAATIWPAGFDPKKMGLREVQ